MGSDLPTRIADDRASPGPGPGPIEVEVEVEVNVPEIREYDRINAEIHRRLDRGATLVRLLGVSGQRLLVSGLRGSWNAVIRVEGDAGPELAAFLDAPGLTVICEGRAADGAGSGLVSGNLVVLGNAGDAAGYFQSGGSIVILGDAGDRCGLRQRGGTLLVNGRVGRLAGERRSGGLLVLDRARVGPLLGFGSETSGIVTS